MIVKVNILRFCSMKSVWFASCRFFCVIHDNKLNILWFWTFEPIKQDIWSRYRELGEIKTGSWRILHIVAQNWQIFYACYCRPNISCVSHFKIIFLVSPQPFVPFISFQCGLKKIEHSDFVERKKFIHCEYLSALNYFIC